MCSKEVIPLRISRELYRIAILFIVLLTDPDILGRLLVFCATCIRAVCFILVDKFRHRYMRVYGTVHVMGELNSMWEKHTVATRQRRKEIQ